MKNMFKTFGAMPCIALIAFIAVMGFSMVSCEPDEHDPNADPAKFYGSWKRSADAEKGITEKTLTFNESGSFTGGWNYNYYYEARGLDKIEFLAGIYASDRNYFTYKYKFKGADSFTLTSTRSGELALNGTYIKQ